MKKERNYTIEFLRFMFAINFLMLHTLAVVPRAAGATPTWGTLFDTIIPFMAFSGYFLMQGFEKNRSALAAANVSPSRQAWHYLKARLISLMPLFVLGTLLGGIAFCVFAGLPLIAWPKYFLDILCEFFGLQIVGYGYGNAFMGYVPDRAAGIAGSMANGPLWFMSGIFICGYLIYYLLAKHRDRFLGFIAPITILLYYGSCYMTNTLPMWTTAHQVGGFAIASGFLNMFCGMSIGVLCYVACHGVKGKQFSTGMKVLLTLAQLLCGGLVMVRTWVSSFSPIYNYLDFGWGVAFLVSTIFTLLCLLNVDYLTRFPLFSSKIWAVPGRLAMYIYVLHYPIILFVARAFGITAGIGEIYNEKSGMILAVSIVVSIVVSYLVMKFEQKILTPWLKTSPWFSKKQRELDAAAVK